MKKIWQMLSTKLFQKYNYKRKISVSYIVFTSENRRGGVIE